MIAVLQWSTLAICALIAIARIPSALRGENRSLFYIFTLMTLAILLSIEAPYVAIDQALGGINLANLLLRFGQFDRAAERYRAALEKFPNHPRVHNNLGVALAQLGRVDEAEAAFRRALALQPDMPEAVQGLRGLEKLRAAASTRPAPDAAPTP